MARVIVRRAAAQMGDTMLGLDFQGAGSGAERWGSGLLWPILRIAALVVCAAALVNWIVDSLAVGAPMDSASRTMTVANLSDDGSMNAAANGRREIAVHANRAGQFILDAVVNGESTRFLVDTGASVLVLSPEDARRIGFNTNTLTYSARYRTANGVAVGAPVVLREFRIGSFSLHDVPATVMARPIPVSLLGMSVLSQFAGHTVEGNKLVLSW